MELFEGNTPIEDMLIDKATRMNSPLGGSIELLPLCNMRCKMCYIYHSKEEMEKEGKLLGYKQWIEIAHEMRSKGVLFLLLTGGEPLLYPNFRELYKELLSMGFVVSINTNGTLIDEEMADFFAQYRCRRLNITIYGCNDETYGELCGNPKGFTQFSRAIELLKQRDISFGLSFTPTPLNFRQFDNILEYAKVQGKELAYTSYLFPSTRRVEKDVYRLQPKEAAEILFIGLRNKYSNIDEKILAAMALQSVKRLPPPNVKGLSCRGGHSGFWANWKGELMVCSMIDEPRISLLEHTFEECWNYIMHETEKYNPCQKCVECSKRSICHTCFAACYAETGKTNQVPEYLCQVTDAYIELLKMYAEE